MLGNFYSSKILSPQATQSNLRYISDWIISDNLNGTRYHIVTRQFGVKCPVGISGAFHLNETYDETFKIECMDTWQTTKCCAKVNVTATGRIKDDQGSNPRKSDFFSLPRRA